MKLFKTSIIILIVSLPATLYAQDKDSKNNKTIDKKSYYEKRAAEDAKFEQQFVAENKDDEEAFWEDQKAYEAELKKKDRKAHRAYVQGKKDAYAEHYEHCNHHCHHSDFYYHHASFYYYRYDNYYYRRSPQRSTINTRINVRTPSVRLGLGL